ncbi:MAG: hypothetical protein WCS96_08020 [Victivallales bacterium]|jgi:hypothetical protein
MSETEKWGLGNKVCMTRFKMNSGESIEVDPRWVKICNWIKSGCDFDGLDIPKWFSRYPITCEVPPDTLTVMDHKDIKAGFAMLQVSCVITDEKGRIALFQRDKDGRAGEPRITDGISILYSWSPHALGAKSVEDTFRTRLQYGKKLKIHIMGCGFNETINRIKNDKSEPGPAYLFIVNKVECKHEEFLLLNSVLPDGSGDRFLGFFHYSEINPDNYKEAMDKLVHDTFLTGKHLAYTGHSAAFNTNCCPAINGKIQEAKEKDLLKLLTGYIPAIQHFISKNLPYLIKLVYNFIDADKLITGNRT